MNPITINRILSQRVNHAPKVSVPVELVVSPPIGLDELRAMLQKELEDKVPEIEPLTDQIVFNSIYEFVDWYIPNQGKFSAQQQVALQTLIQTRDYINVGCNCTRPNRERGASDYFRDFWLKNAQTDMMPTLLAATGAKKVVFGSFLIYPITYT
jgi:hypothetical protein